MSRWIDAEWLIKESMPLSFSVQKWVNEVQIMTAPSIDIVFCKECKHYDKFPTWSACTYWSGDPYEQASVNPNDFCSYGERREP